MAYSAQNDVALRSSSDPSDTKGIREDTPMSVGELDDDFYIFEEKEYLIRGRHSGRVFQLGDAVRVKIWRTNLEKKQLDFLLAGENGNNTPRGRKE